MDWVGKLTAREEKLRSAHGLTAKADGWYKSVNGRTRYICKRLPLMQALELLPGKLKEFAEANGGALPARSRVVLTIERLAEQFVAAMRVRMETGVPKPLARQTFDDYVDVLDRFVECVGPDKPAAMIGPSDFTKFIMTLAGRAKSTLRREIQYIDRLFNWAGPGKRSMNLIPFVFRGPDWIKPTDDEIGTAGVDADKAYTSEQLRCAFAAVDDNPMLVAAAWLGLCGGFIPIDVATLPESFIDLQSGLIRFPRGKTGVRRICWIPPQGISAIEVWLRKRERFKCDASADGLLFRTRMGFPVHRRIINDETDDGMTCSALTSAWMRATGLPFTGLRSTFATVADEWPDERAIDMVLGHKIGRVSSHVRARHYAKRFNPDRVQRLTSYCVAVAFGQTVPAPHIAAGWQRAVPSAEPTRQSEIRASA